MTETRLTELEESVAYLARTVDDLHEVVARQSGEIDLLTRRLRIVMERLAEDEALNAGSVPLADQRPPHW